MSHRGKRSSYQIYPQYILNRLVVPLVDESIFISLHPIGTLQLLIISVVKEQ
jgi:hypothetical protein